MSLKIEREKRVVALFKPEDRRRLEELREAIQKTAVAAADEPKRLNDTDSPTREAVSAHDKFKAQAFKRATKVSITALRGKEWRDLLAAHPPRKDVLDDEGEPVESWPQDAEVGFNVDTMSRPLVVAALVAYDETQRADGGEPQFDSLAELEEFVDDLSDPDFSRIYSEAYRVNTEAGEDPKWSASSWLEQTSAAMSRSAETSDSPPASSTD